MNRHTAFLIIVLSTLSMSGIIWLQVKWVLKASELKDEQFNNHLEIAMWWVSNKLEQELDQPENSGIAQADSAVFAAHAKKRIEELTVTILTWFNLNEMRYELKIVPMCCDKGDFTWSGKTYRCSATRQLKERGLEFRLIAEDKEGWIMSQLKFFFLFSILLILLVMVCFVLTLRTLWRQKKIFETTTDFISNMTHEFKTPITNVSFASNLLKKVQPVLGSERATKLNNIIFEENKKLQHHVEQILNLARLEKGELTLNRIDFNIHEAIEESIHSMDLQVRKRKGRIHTYFEAQKESLQGDKTHIVNTITNLIDNANKYSLQEPEISIRTFNKDNGIVVAVEDNGIGMSREKQKLVFNKFYRAPTGNAHDVKGFGLGLSYAKMVMEAHRGSIGVTSEQGRGSCFQIFFPTTTQPAG